MPCENCQHFALLVSPGVTLRSRTEKDKDFEVTTLRTSPSLLKVAMEGMGLLEPAAS